MDCCRGLIIQFRIHSIHLPLKHYVAGIRKERMSKLEEMLKASGFPSDRIKSIIRIGDPADELLKAAVAEKVDMIVMGIKGRTNLEYMFVGSVADQQ